MIVRRLPDHLQDFARFGYLTGTRKAEIGKLTWADADRDAGKITFRREHAKNGQPRVIPLVGELFAIIERRWEPRKLGLQIFGAGIDQVTAMKISGHRTASVCQRYRIVTDDDVRATLERTEAAAKTAGPRVVVPFGARAPEAGLLHDDRDEDMGDDVAKDVAAHHVEPRGIRRRVPRLGEVNDCPPCRGPSTERSSFGRDSSCAPAYASQLRTFEDRPR
jgi:hypothetical protein